MAKTVGKSVSDTSSTYRKPKVRYPVSKFKIFLLSIIFLAMCILGYFVLKVNRDIVGRWNYVGEADFFTGEVSEPPKDDSHEIQVKKQVKIVITEYTIELLVGGESHGKTEYTMTDNTIVGADSVTRLDVEWHGFTPSFNGTLFEKTGLIENLERWENPDHTIKNVIFIIMFSVLGLILLFVVTMKGKSYTVKMDSPYASGGAAVSRSAIARSDEGRSASSDLSRSSYAPSLGGAHRRTAVPKVAVHSAFKQGADLDLTNSVYSLEKSEAYSAKIKSSGFRETIYVNNSSGRKDIKSVNSERTTGRTGTETKAESGYFGSIASEAKPVGTPTEKKTETKSKWFGSAGDL